MYDVRKEPKNKIDVSSLGYKYNVQYLIVECNSFMKELLDNDGGRSEVDGEYLYGSEMSISADTSYEGTPQICMFIPNTGTGPINNIIKYFTSLEQFTEFVEGLKVIPNKNYAKDRIVKLRHQIIQIEKDYGLGAKYATTEKWHSYLETNSINFGKMKEPKNITVDVIDNPSEYTFNMAYGVPTICFDQNKGISFTSTKVAISFAVSFLSFCFARNALEKIVQKRMKNNVR